MAAAPSLVPAAPAVQLLVTGADLRLQSAGPSQGDPRLVAESVLASFPGVNVPLHLLQGLVAEDAALRSRAALDGDPLAGCCLQSIQEPSGDLHVYFPTGCNGAQLGGARCWRDAGGKWRVAQHENANVDAEMVKMTAVAMMEGQSSREFDGEDGDSDKGGEEEVEEIGEGSGGSDDHSSEGRRESAVHRGGVAQSSSDSIREAERAAIGSQRVVHSLRTSLSGHYALTGPLDQPIKQVAWNPYFPGTEAAIVLDDGSVHFLRFRRGTSAGLLEAAHVPVASAEDMFTGSQAGVAAAMKNAPGLWPAAGWWHCEYGGHPETLLVASQRHVLLVNVKDGLGVRRLVDAAGLHAFSLSRSPRERFWSLATSSPLVGGSGFHFAVADASHVMLFDVRQPQAAMLQWEHLMDEPPQLLFILRHADGYTIVAASLVSGRVSCFSYTSIRPEGAVDVSSKHLQKGPALLIASPTSSLKRLLEAPGNQVLEGPDSVAKQRLAGVALAPSASSVAILRLSSSRGRLVIQEFVAHLEGHGLRRGLSKQTDYSDPCAKLKMDNVTEALQDLARASSFPTRAQQEFPSVVGCISHALTTTRPPSALVKKRKAGNLDLATRGLTQPQLEARLQRVLEDMKEPVTLRELVVQLHLEQLPPSLRSCTVALPTDYSNLGQHWHQLGYSPANIEAELQRLDGAVPEPRDATMAKPQAKADLQWRVHRGIQSITREIRTADGSDDQLRASHGSDVPQGLPLAVMLELAERLIDLRAAAASSPCFEDILQREAELANALRQCLKELPSEAGRLSKRQQLSDGASDRQRLAAAASRLLLNRLVVASASSPGPDWRSLARSPRCWTPMSETEERLLWPHATIVLPHEFELRRRLAAIAPPNKEPDGDGKVVPLEEDCVGEEVALAELQNAWLDWQGLPAPTQLELQL
eukprot:SM000061S19258  [mRNA]  locus=s61:444873:451494:+ [translate_table: standard]